MSAKHKSSVRRKHHHGILPDHRGQDQPTDKSRAQQVSRGDEAGERRKRSGTRRSNLSRRDSRLVGSGRKR
jgi:hypothetical protein